MKNKSTNQAYKAIANQSKSSSMPAKKSITGSRGSQSRDLRTLHNSKSRHKRLPSGPMEGKVMRLFRKSGKKDGGNKSRRAASRLKG